MGVVFGKSCMLGLKILNLILQERLLYILVLHPEQLLGGLFLLLLQVVFQFLDLFVLHEVFSHALSDLVDGKKRQKLALVDKDADELDSNDGATGFPVAMTKDYAENGEHDHLLHNEVHVVERLDLLIQPTLPDVLDG
jgi:hypothetical protein